MGTIAGNPREEPMGIHYIEPLSRGIQRMKKALFSPATLKKWLVTGFAAFLAGLADVTLSGPPGYDVRKHSNITLEDVFSFPQSVLEWLANHPFWAILIAFSIFILSVLGLVLTWLSSRGKFIFLDNVVQDRAAIVAPWYEYRKEGNSFFLWNFFWGVFFTATTMACLVYSFRMLRALYQNSGDGRVLIVPAILAGLALAAISAVNLFLFVLLRDFVVPIMYRDRINAWSAVLKLLPLLFSQLLHFIGYGLFLFCISLVIVLAILIVGCVTCCIGFIILAIPYLNSIILLPISYALRAFSVEFLEQFGPEFRIFPKPVDSLPDSQTQMV
jgi:hypothetical protein